MPKYWLIKLAKFYLISFSLIVFSLLTPRETSAASFTISNTAPFLGEQITIAGSGLTSNNSYYLLIDEAGPYVDYTDTTYQGETARLFSSSQLFTGTGYYWSTAYDEFDSVFFTARWYDEVVASPLWKIQSADIYWYNGGGAVTTVDINGTGSNSWKWYKTVLEKKDGVQTFGFNFIKLGSNNIYFDKVQKYPLYNVTTDGSGNFSKTINTPRRLNRNSGLTFTYLLYNPTGDTTETVGSITLSPNYDYFRELKDMITFHYVHLLPESFEGNWGSSFANQFRKSVALGMLGDWEAPFVGGIFYELGNNSLGDEAAIRLCNATGSDGRLYPAGAGNYNDVTIAGWYVLYTTYQRNPSLTFDSGEDLLTCMNRWLSYTMLGYNSTYNTFFHVSTNPNEVWVDALGMRPQFLYWMGNVLGDSTYKTRADDLITYIIDKLQDPEGWFNFRWDMTTNTAVYSFWDGGQGWAINGLLTYKNVTTNTALISKINASLEKLADNLSSRNIADIRDDIRRSPYIAYGLLKASEDTSFSISKRENWAKRGRELFILSLKDKNSEYSNMNRYGLTYDPDLDETKALADYYFLKILSEIETDTFFYPNNIGSNYEINRSLGANDIYQAYVDNRDTWTVTNDYYNRVDSTGNTLKGTSIQGRVVKYKKRNMTASISSGNLDVRIEDWQDQYRKFTMTSAANQNVGIAIWNLSGNTKYRILRDGSFWKEVTANSSGYISFTYDGGFSIHTFEVQSTKPSISLDDSITLGVKGKLRLKGNASDDKNNINAVEYLVNGGNWLNAVPVDSAFDSASEAFYLDFLASDSGYLQDGYAVKVRAKNSADILSGDTLFFAPFYLNSPKNYELTTSKPTFSFSVNKGRFQDLKDLLANYQIQIKKLNQDWEVYFDNIPIFYNGTYGDTNIWTSYSKDFSQVTVGSRLSSKKLQPGRYEWRAVAVNKTGDIQETKASIFYVVSVDKIPKEFEEVETKETKEGKIGSDTTKVKVESTNPVPVKGIKVVYIVGFSVLSLFLFLLLLRKLKKN